MFLAVSKRSSQIAAKRRSSQGIYFSAWTRAQQELKLPEKQVTIEKFNFPKKTHTIEDISLKFSALESTKSPVTLHGWIDTKLKKFNKKLLFGKLRDSGSKVVQFVVNDEALVKKTKELRVEDAVSITGTVGKKPAKSAQQQKEAEEQQPQWDLTVTAIQNLNRASVVGSQLEPQKKINPYEFPAEYRYLQLRQPEFQNILRKRSIAANTIRHELIQDGFIEVETPLLFKSTPEGAREFLVPTRRKDQFYALPQSPQQYKQLLMASGVPKYFQIAKCFRDEDLRADRQPEFTQVDLEMAFATAEDVQQVIEKLILATWKTVRNLPIFVPVDDNLMIPFEESGLKSFPKLDYIDALRNYGIDKPDLRSTLKFTDISDYVTSAENKEFPVVEVCILRDAFTNKTDLNGPFTKLIDEIQYKARIPKIVAIETVQDVADWFTKVEKEGIAKFNTEKLSVLQEQLALRPGDIIACSTRAQFPYENPTPLGRFRQVAIETYPKKWRRKITSANSQAIVNAQTTKNENVFIASWVVNFPLFSPEEPSENSKYPEYDKTKFVSTHHPFTMLKVEDYDYLANEKDFLKIKGDHYDLVVNGVELGGGSRRIHDTDLQKYIFQKVLKIENPERLFGHLLKAFELGCPPHAGLAIGFDRMVAMLLGYSSIKNVIAFPKNQSGADMVVNSPSSVTDERLADYKIKVREN